MHTFRDVATAAYCPRKLYYRRRDPDEPDIPEEIGRLRALAHCYKEILAGERSLEGVPIDVTPTQYRTRLGRAKARLDAWPALADPEGRDVLLTGREVRGRAHKVLETPSVSLAFGGTPPDQGVWKPQSVRLVAAAKALSWEQETTVETAFAEYPAHGIVRRVPINSRRRAIYREAIRAAESIDGPPPRIDNDAKCPPCDVTDQCGTRTRSLRSLLGG